MVNKDEIELQGNEDYEVVPLTPLRRLEKRIEMMETTKSTQNLERFVDKILDMTEMNQKIVDEMVKSNQSLREDVGVLIGKMDSLNDNMNEFVSLIKSAGEHDTEATSKAAVTDAITPVVDKMAEIMKNSQDGNDALAETLENIDKRLKRMQTTPTTAKPVSNILARRGMMNTQTNSPPPQFNTK
ncbi:MAG: hypothetical protein KAS12_00395 [Candidatus Aenigmarchaeota archaeon]|nr:hypothetical protein [Candidatus Aenigmarchaeota archaeon]